MIAETAAPEMPGRFIWGLAGPRRSIDIDIADHDVPAQRGAGIDRDLGVDRFSE